MSVECFMYLKPPTYIQCIKLIPHRCIHPSTVTQTHQCSSFRPGIIHHCTLKCNTILWRDMLLFCTEMYKNTNAYNNQWGSSITSKEPLFLLCQHIQYMSCHPGLFHFCWLPTYRSISSVRRIFQNMKIRLYFIPTHACLNRGSHNVFTVW